MINKKHFAAAALVSVMLGGAACGPTVKVSFTDPLVINASLTADIRIRLDKELQDLLANNPNLF